MTNPGLLNLQDASLIVSQALPAAHSASVNTANLDVGPLHQLSAHYEQCDLLLSYPALSLAQLPNTSVITYQIQASADPAFGSGVRNLGQATQTGATGTASQPAGQLRSKLPSDCPQYIRAVASTDANGASCAAASVQLQLVF